MGKEKSNLYWHSLLRQAILNSYLRKDIEQYGLLKITKKGRDFISAPTSFKISMNHDYSSERASDAITGTTSNGSALDEVLVDMLKKLRLQEAKRRNVKPWIIFLDPSLQDMATYYPTSTEDMLNISGVSKGKAERYGRPFIELIKDYIEVNEIEKPSDLVIRQVADKSRSKVSIIQGVDRKMPLEDIANSSEISLDALIDEMNMIVSSGTKLDINYYLEDNIDEEVVEEIYDYFHDADSESIQEAFDELKEEDITKEEIQLVRIKFMSDMAN